MYSGYGPGLVPAAESASKVLTGEGWKKLTPEHLPLIENDVPGLVRVPVLEAAPSGLLPDGYALPVAGSKDGKLYAQTPTIPEAHGALIEGATSGIWGPQSGLMPGADKDKLDGIDYKANHYVLPQATETELGGVKASVINNLSEGGEALLKQYSRIVVDEDGIAYADLGSVKERIAENVQTITNAEIDEICV